MSARPKQVLRQPADQWEEFRPAHATPRGSRHSLRFKLLLTVLVFAAITLTWFWFRTPIQGTVAQIKKAISGLGQPRTAAKKARAAAPVSVHRTRRESRVEHEAWAGDAGQPGPFEVYLLDGDRYVRVDSSSRSVLLNMQTGEATWIYSDALPDARN